MNFIRNNWSRLSLALIFLLGGILGIVAFANSGMFNLDVDNATKFFHIALLISTLVYFFGMVCVTVLKAVAGKKAVSITYMVMGGIISILNIVVLCVCVNKTNLISLTQPYPYGINALFEFIVPTLVFGLYPLLKGITRFVEAEHTPAPVKPAVQQAATEAPAKAETAAPAAKTTATKATATKTTAAKTTKKTTAAK